MMGITIDRLDHIVLTVVDVEVTREFYCRLLRMKPVNFGDDRIALVFGQQKINLHPVSNGYTPKAERPMPGSGDLCFISKNSVDDVIAHLEGEGVKIIEGPVRKTGALGSITSVYFYDPDGNLIEISNYN